MDSIISSTVIAMLIGVIASAILTYLVMWAGLRQGVMDIPNSRSSHSSPVPRGGGLAVIATFYAFLFIYPEVGELPFGNDAWMSLLLGGAIIAAVGALDDVSHIRARWRFLVHLIAAVIVLEMLPVLPVIEVFGKSFPLNNIGIGVYAFCMVWFVNLYNFMDGIDGLAGIEAITALGSAALVIFIHGQSEWLLPLGYLSACIAGFLVWNWPPAKIFMGDAGSGFLGFVVAFLAIETSAGGAISPWTWAIVLGVFIVDATMTLIVRMARGAKWYEAHRSHAYQILTRRYESHYKVTIGVVVINLFWLLPLGYLASTYPFWGLLCCVIAWTPLVTIVIKVGAGHTDTPVPQTET